MRGASSLRGRAPLFLIVPGKKPSYNRYCSRFLNVENRVARMGSKVDSDRTVADERNANKRAPIYIYIYRKLISFFFFYHGRIFVSVDPICKRERDVTIRFLSREFLSILTYIYIIEIETRSFRYSFFTYR